MDTFANKLYTMGYETSWNAPAVGNAKTSRHCNAERGHTIPNGRRHAECQFKFGRSLASNVPEARPARVAAKAERRTTLPLVRGAERTAEADSAERIAGRWLFHRSLDVETGRGSDPQTFRDSLPVHSRLACDVCRIKVELAETRTASDPAGRRGDCALEEDDLAADKKKPKRGTRTWSSSMKAASCLSPMWPRLGRRSARPLCSGTATSGTRSRRFRESPSLPPAAAWDFISSSTRPTSPARKSLRSCGTSCVTCAVTWNSFGMEAPSTEEKTFKHFWRIRKGSVPIASRDTRRSLIRMNSSGPRPSMTCPTAPQRTSTSWDRRCAAPSAASKAPSDFCGRASRPLSCLGRDAGCIHCLSKCQYERCHARVLHPPDRCGPQREPDRPVPGRSRSDRRGGDSGGH